jgi:hypothetical protein
LPYECFIFEITLSKVQHERKGGVEEGCQEILDEFG